MSTASPACAARGFSNIAGPARRAGRDRGAERPQLRLRLADGEPRGAYGCRRSTMCCRARKSSRRRRTSYRSELP